MKKYMSGALLSLIMIGCGGGGSSSSQIGTGYYVDSAVKGVEFHCGNQEGLTEEGGRFSFEVGKECRFYVNNHFFKSVASAQLIDEVIIQEKDPNIARFLLTLDNDQNPDNGIVILEEVAKKVEAIPLSEVDYATLLGTLKKDLPDVYHGRAYDLNEAKEHLKNAASSVKAVAMISPASPVTQGESVTFSASGSSAKGSMTYDWREGNIRLSTQESFSKDDFTVGIHTVTLTVKDAKGNSATDEITFEIKELKNPSKWDNITPLVQNGTNALFVTSDDKNLYLKVVADNNVSTAQILINSDDNNLSGFHSSIWGEGFDYIVKNDGLYTLKTGDDYHEKREKELEYKVTENANEIEVTLDRGSFKYLAENIAMSVFFPNQMAQNIPSTKPTKRFKDSFYNPNQADSVPPILVLNGASFVQIKEGGSYNEAGATAIDVIDGNVTANIIIDSSDLDITKAGFYQVIYSVKDSHDNKAKIVRIVEVEGASTEKTLEIKELGVLGDKVAINHQTGLVWANDNRGEATTRGCIIFSGGSEATMKANFEDFCSNSDYAGFTDWRVPTSLELSKFTVQMAQEGKIPGMARKACVRTIALDNNTTLKAVWTNNQQLNSKETDKSPHAGYVESSPLTPAGGRCVRGGIDNDKGGFSWTQASLTEAKVITDSHNHMWVNEFNPKMKGCLAIHVDKPDEYNTSKTFCSALKYAGHEDWRDPTAQELSIFVKESNEAHIFIGFEAPCKRLLARSADGNESAVSTRFDTSKALGTITPLEQNLTSNIGLRCVRDN